MSWYSSLVPNLTVFEKEPKHSGLLDKDGRPLIQRKEPIGFINFEKIKEKEGK